MTSLSILRIFGLSTLVVLAACDESSTQPSSGALATIRVGTETFKIWLQRADQIEAAQAALAGGAASIPNGRIVTGAEFNTGWSWHLEDVTFTEAAIELCDGLPSAVEREGTGFGGGRFCPWTARVVAVDKV